MKRLATTPTTNKTIKIIVVRTMNPVPSPSWNSSLPSFPVILEARFLEISIVLLIVLVTNDIFIIIN